MGWTYFRSVKFGPLRLNLSSSGIGVSTGIPGLRIGKGPRGAYISGGMGGFRYRKYLGKSRRAAKPLASSGTAPVVRPSYPTNRPAQAVNPNVVTSVVHGTKSASELGDGSQDSVLQIIREQLGRPAYARACLGATLALTIVAGLLLPSEPAVALAMLVLGSAASVWMHFHDKARRLVVLYYDPDPHARALFDELHTALQPLLGCSRFQSVAETSQYVQRKYTAGAHEGLTFAPASVRMGQLPGIAANVNVPILTADATTLAFYPDRILVRQGSSVGSVDYHELAAVSQVTQFIESGTPPADATVVAHTWQYVNKSGGPDRRFANNRQLPVCSYGLLKMHTASGLDLRFMASRANVFDAFVAALQRMRRTQATPGHVRPTP
ncbi:DUF4236 domain-containing protein [Thiomonas sp. FB-6]|uniref:DUF4236 domain-containing protein n=1 Tax=Thiomonas sp. FB-6 TaxID=1158291 RepID=UPI00037C2684|nr:DUF4236 domain-containing protein [Thiomonas sp. FB-6]